jgi:hypothetical protein
MGGTWRIRKAMQLKARLGNYASFVASRARKLGFEC